MIEAPLVGLEWCTNYLLKNHKTISQIDYNYIFRGNKLGYAPNRFSYPFLRTVILLFDIKKVSFVYQTKETFLRDAFLAERDAHCVRDAASPVMHALRVRDASHRLSQCSCITHHFFAMKVSQSEMPAGVGGFISFHVPLKRNISQ